MCVCACVSVCLSLSLHSLCPCLPLVSRACQTDLVSCRTPSLVWDAQGRWLIVPTNSEFLLMQQNLLFFSL